MAEIKVSHKNWIGSERGMVLKTAMITNTTAVTKQTEEYSDGTNHVIAKSGSVVNDTVNGIYGLLYNDVDVTAGGRHASVMMAGHYIASNLPATVASEIAAKFAAQGLFPIVEIDAIRPDWAEKTT